MPVPTIPVDSCKRSHTQVAIDVPGFGDTKAPSLDSFVSEKLLTEIIRSLAKQHAYAIVAYAQGAAALLKVLLEDPKLTSFL